MKSTRYRTTRKKKERGIPRRALLAAAALLVFGGVVYVLAQPTPKVEVTVHGAPSLLVEPESYDFGDVKLEETVSVAFEISNVGDQPLEFSRAPYVEVLEGC